MTNINRIRGFEEVKKDQLKVPGVKTQLPIRSDRRSAGYDFFAKEDAILLPGEKHLFWTDVKSYMLHDEVLEIHVRSSVGIKRDATLANTTGIIDSSYYENPDNDGNIGICLKNSGTGILKIKVGERIAQGVFSKYLITDDDQPTNEERTGGIGSSGK